MKRLMETMKKTSAIFLAAVMTVASVPADVYAAPRVLEDEVIGDSSALPQNDIFYFPINFKQSSRVKSVASFHHFGIL